MNLGKNWNGNYWYESLDFLVTLHIIGTIYLTWSLSILWTVMWSKESFFFGRHVFLCAYSSEAISFYANIRYIIYSTKNLDGKFKLINFKFFDQCQKSALHLLLNIFECTNNKSWISCYLNDLNEDFHLSLKNIWHY